MSRFRSGRSLVGRFRSWGGSGGGGGIMMNWLMMRVWLSVVDRFRFMMDRFGLMIVMFGLMVNVGVNFRVLVINFRVWVVDFRRRLIVDFRLMVDGFRGRWVIFGFWCGLGFFREDFIFQVSIEKIVFNFLIFFFDWGTHRFSVGGRSGVFGGWGIRFSLLIFRFVFPDIYNLDFLVKFTFDFWFGFNNFWFLDFWF